MASIAVCMIVRDEALVIERCLASIRGLVDAWVICDTGSTDGTPELIDRVLGDIPGALHHRPWRDFGHNRSELMELARGAAEYLLLIDADMTIEQHATLPPLVADAYLLRHAGDLEYWIPRLVRGDRAWRFQGPTHEYLASDGDVATERLDPLVIVDHADGSSRAVKLERDRALLESYLTDHPDDERSVFYLAQTYADLGDTDRAIELYERRTGMGGFGEEAWVALLRRGELLADRDFEAASSVLLAAADRAPSRAEPLYRLATEYRFREHYDLALRYAAAGRSIPLPAGALFVDRNVYDWALDFEYAIAAYWTGHMDEARTVNERLVDNDRLPRWIAPYVRMNLDHCRVALGLERLSADDRGYILDEVEEPLLSDLVGRMRSAEISLSVRPFWPVTNPSICSDGDGFRMIARTVNYVRSDDDVFTVIDQDEDVVRTLNYVLDLNTGLEVTNVAPLGEVLEPTVPRIESPVRGFEDLRLFRAGGRWMASGTTREFHPGGLCRIALVDLTGDEVRSATVLEGPDLGRHEKNWMPFVVDGHLRFVYSCGPTVVVAPRPDGSIETLSSYPGPPSARGFRGGTQGLDVDGGFLFVIHEVDVVGWAPVYTHRFVRLGHDHRIDAMSPRFRFFGEPVEFCAGLARKGDELVLSFGVRDHHAFIAVVDEASVSAMLEPTGAAAR